MKTLKFILIAILLLASIVQPAAAANNAQHFWTITGGQWGIRNGKLANDVESWIWAGSPPITTHGDFQAHLTIEFSNTVDEFIGRHGGIMFYASTPTHRWDATNSGYTIDWIDVYWVHGFRLIRWDNGYPIILSQVPLYQENVPSFWELKTEGDLIRFFADGQLIFEYADGTYRDGHFGIWAMPNGTQILVDDVQVGNSFNDSFTGNVTPPGAPPLPSMPPNQHFWTLAGGQWGISDGKLTLQPFSYNAESWIWAGSPPITTQGDFQAQLTIKFTHIPLDGAGRHGGIMFYATVPTNRGDPVNSGYTIDWLDGNWVHGFRLIRWDNGYPIILSQVPLYQENVPSFWELKTEGDLIRFFADGQLIFEYADGTYRDGHFGIWVYSNTTQILVDDVQIGNSFNDSFTGILTHP